MKALLVILDGVGDRGTKTALSLAKKPNLDNITRKSITGLMHPIDVGVVPGSDTAHLAIFGYDPYKYYKGRGLFEALGANMELKEGDVAFRTNFATLDSCMNITDRRVGRDDTGLRELSSEIDGMELEGIKVVFKHTTEHRGVLILRGRGLSDRVSNTDPHGGRAKVIESKPLDNSKESKFTAHILNEFT